MKSTVIKRYEQPDITLYDAREDPDFAPGRALDARVAHEVLFMPYDESYLVFGDDVYPHPKIIGLSDESKANYMKVVHELQEEAVIFNLATMYNGKWGWFATVCYLECPIMSFHNYFVVQGLSWAHAVCVGALLIPKTSRDSNHEMLQYRNVPIENKED
jgi:hypothetical protein